MDYKMNTVVVETNTLPLPIREKFHTSKVSMKDNDDGSVILLPLRDISELRGIAKGSTFTSEKLFENRREEKNIEDEGFKK